MKKYIPILLATSLLLSACSIWIKDDLFQKKQECANMKDKIQQEQRSWTYVEEVFYSKKINSCLYVVENDWGKSIKDRFWDESNWLENATTEDFCTTKFWSTKDDGWKEALKYCLEKSKDFDQKLKELKWE